ncbi:MAG: hypothetical protein ABSC94_00560 [Polyangiaceae bacterium]|jgi:hypothetical protein
MRIRMKAQGRFVVGVAAFIGLAVGPACSASSSSFQPVAYGAKPWTPPAGWNPEPPCSTGYYVAITSCEGCSGTSYALCDGNSFTQCVCGGSFWSGATCPLTIQCSSDDFPPPSWSEFTDYAGPGWAGLAVMADASAGAVPTGGDGGGGD